jgi:beta propeller repeat protein
MNRTSWIAAASRIAAATACLLLCAPAPPAGAQQQYQGLCARVKIEILQEMTLERIGFLATLQVTNNEGTASITDFAATLSFENPALTTEASVNDSSGIFFVQPPKLEGVSSIDGTGIIRPGETARISWFIIPKMSAGGTSAAGVRYKVGAQLAGSIFGQQISPDTLKVIPDIITVKPEPELDIAYFQPRDVTGDDPFTPDVVESPIPFTLGVLVRNVGYGRARSIKIASQQPRIVESSQNLLLVAQLLGARVDDQPTDQASLTVDLGDIEPGKCRKGAWDMVTSLSGEFIEFKASYTHASELGGQETSVIRSMNAYFILHEVLNDQPGRDKLLDFLADTVPDDELLPDAIYESDCNVLPVNRLLQAAVTSASGLTATIHATADFANWVYMRFEDPAQAKLKIASVVRSDGKVLNPHNSWTTVRYERGTNRKLTDLHILDFVNLGVYDYTVTYAPAAADPDPPVTTLRFSGEVREQGGKFFVRPETQVYFTAEDANPVATFYKMDAGAFVPAYPFTILQNGEHVIEYYSRDAANNEEVHKTAALVLSDDFPGIANVTLDGATLFIVGDSLSVRPTEARFGFDAVSSLSGLTAQGEVFRGTYGWPTVGGVPSSPTASHAATLTIGGNNVDFYRYRIGGGSWSAEAPVAEALQLTGLAAGAVDLAVSGRNAHGTYPSDSEAVAVSWTIDDGATLSVTGAPATPTGSDGAALSVSGSDYFCYRVDGGFYQPNLAAGAPIALTRLSEASHTVEVRSRAGLLELCPETGAGTAVGWTVDRQYGLRLPAAERVYHQALGTGTNFEFVWTGRDDAGVMVAPGWYSVKLSVTDTLGRVAGAVVPVEVGDILAGGQAIAEAGSAAQKEAHAAGLWAVWQDQRNGDWDIYSRELRTGAPPVRITDTAFSQERPRTDGAYVVWEDRRDNGTWDVWARKVDGSAAAFAVTATPDVDERRPVVDWPWVVWQAKPVSDPTAPWQLFSRNLSTGVTAAVDATAFDQVDPAIRRQSVVWQDSRDVGPGEIYEKDLKTGELRRVTVNPAGQYWPAISDEWIVWSDNRSTQLDLYGFNRVRGTEVRLTQTPENERRPHVNGKWVAYEEDAGGASNVNIRLLSLANLASAQLTNYRSLKELPSTASGRLVWVDSRSGVRQAMIGDLPDLQPVFDNRNMVAVTPGMVAHLQDAYQLLTVWNREAGITEITRYTALLPQPAAESVSWVAGAPAGGNFTLVPGTFLWVKFGDTKILDLGTTDCAPLDLGAGASVFGYSCFPDRFSAYRLIRQLGAATVKAVRLLDAETGRWTVASVTGGLIAGEDFPIPRIAVLMLDLNAPVTGWRPGE